MSKSTVRCPTPTLEAALVVACLWVAPAPASDWRTFVDWAQQEWTMGHLDQARSHLQMAMEAARRIPKDRVGTDGLPERVEARLAALGQLRALDSWAQQNGWPSGDLIGNLRKEAYLRLKFTSPDSPATLECLDLLARQLTNQGEGAEADQVLVRAIEMLRARARSPAALWPLLELRAEHATRSASPAAAAARQAFASALQVDPAQLDEDQLALRARLQSRVAGLAIQAVDGPGALAALEAAQKWMRRQGRFGALAHATWLDRQGMALALVGRTDEARAAFDQARSKRDTGMFFMEDPMLAGQVVDLACRLGASPDAARSVPLFERFFAATQYLEPELIEQKRGAVSYALSQLEQRGLVADAARLAARMPPRPPQPCIPPGPGPGSGDCPPAALPTPGATAPPAPLTPASASTSPGPAGTSSGP